MEQRPIKTHKYPPGAPLGDRTCIHCALSETQEYRFPHCEIIDIPRQLALPKTVTKKKNGKWKENQGDIAVRGWDDLREEDWLDNPAYPSLVAPEPICYESHLPLTIGGHSIWGGSCAHPMEDMDIYLGLDVSMRSGPQELPWTSGHAFRYLITDMKAPGEVIYFAELIDWLYAQMQQGQKIHVGCIGGHGRTGTVLAALASLDSTIQNPIQYVRENYCKKAVETGEQIRFLMKHFGCQTAKPSKGGAKVIPVETKWRK